jgi:hypothetical protein
MQAAHTLGLPPYQGKIYRARIGCTWKSRNALRKTADIKSGKRAVRFSVAKLVDGFVTLTWVAVLMC